MAVKVLFEATIIGGELGTVEVGGSTDFAEWVPLGRRSARAPGGRRRRRRLDGRAAGVAARLTARRDGAPRP